MGEDRLMADDVESLSDSVGPVRLTRRSLSKQSSASSFTSIRWLASSPRNRSALAPPAAASRIAASGCLRMVCSSALSRTLT